LRRARKVSLHGRNKKGKATFGEFANKKNVSKGTCCENDPAGSHVADSHDSSFGESVLSKKSERRRAKKAAARGDPLVSRVTETKGGYVVVLMAHRIKKMLVLTSFCRFFGPLRVLSSVLAIYSFNGKKKVECRIQ